MIKQFWNLLLSALVPVSGTDQHGRDLEATFKLLTHLMKVLVTLTAIWAIAAGFLQTARFIKYIPRGFPGREAVGFWADRADWIGPLLAVPVYALKAFGVIMLLGLAAAMVGGFLGFLFALPRMLPGTTSAAPTVPGPEAPAPTGQAATAAASAAGSAASSGQLPAAGAAAAFRSGRGWQSSTNLTEISDWLTKIIVGVGLVEAKRIYDQLSQLSRGLGTMLFDGAVGSLLVIPAVIVTSALLGFLYWYLFTQLLVAGLFARSDVELSNAGAPLQDGGTVLVLSPEIQSRKVTFSDYIQDLVNNEDRNRLDEIARRLEVPTAADLRTERRNILAAVSNRVDNVNVEVAGDALTELSNSLHAITDRDF
jgi:hypothetical protein